VSSRCSPKEAINGEWRRRLGYPASAAPLISEGRPIYTLDGYKLGEAADLNGAYMKVHALQAADYWLRTCVIHVGDHLNSP
jgi:hypothetical protein